MWAPLSGCLSCRSISARQAEGPLQQVLYKHGADGPNPKRLQTNCRVSVLISVWALFPVHDAGLYVRLASTSGQLIQLTTPVLLCSAFSSQPLAMLASSRQPPELCSQLPHHPSVASCEGTCKAATQFLANPNFCRGARQTSPPGTGEADGRGEGPCYTCLTLLTTARDNCGLT